ncbi:MAG: hypothetical protein JNM90_10475 [Burkholderiales bacterium]|nr:hypothetical protein [Burkholderiales bacterium]
MMRALRRGLAATAAALACHAGAAGSIALLGDIPYGDYEAGALRVMLEEIGADADVAAVVHVGDIKAGNTPCDDALFLARRAEFDQSARPFLLVPGDNEWTDCHRDSNGRFDPRERLARLREVFFADAYSLGRHRLRLTRQGDLQPRFAAWRENVRWEHERVLFVALNVPGSNNNWKRRGDNAEFRDRLAANTAWLGAAFAHAGQAGALAVMVIIHGNPDFEEVDARRRAGHRDGYAEFRAQLAREARAFARPVAIVHGDTHRMRIDQPLRDARGEPVANVTRVETFGSPALGWIKATIDPAAPAVFRFAPRRYVPRP